MSALTLERATAATLKVMPPSLADNVAQASRYAMSEMPRHEIRDALAWYPHERCTLVALAALAEGGRYPVTQMVGAFAALSPGCGIDRNRALLVDLVTTGDCAHHYGAVPIGKARLILAGAEPLSALKGQKERAFFLCLDDPESDGPVCVDRHMLSVAYGRPMVGRDLRILERVGAFEIVADAVRLVAAERGLVASALQALVWCWWRQYGRRVAPR